MRSKKKTRITSLCKPLPIRMGITKGQWIYLLALAVEFGAVALVGKLGDMNVASMFVAAKMFDRRGGGGKTLTVFENGRHWVGKKAIFVV